MLAAALALGALAFAPSFPVQGVRSRHTRTPPIYAVRIEPHPFEWANPRAKKEKDVPASPKEVPAFSKEVPTATFRIPKGGAPKPAENYPASQQREDDLAAVIKRAIDAELDLPVKRSRSQAQQLEKRVAEARALTDMAIDERARALVNTAVDEWMSDQIDVSQLHRRKAEARDEAAAEQDLRVALDQADDAHSEAMQARDAAFLAYQEAEAAVDAAEAAVNAALAPLEPNSSAIKQKADVAVERRHANHEVEDVDMVIVGDGDCIDVDEADES